VVAAIEEADVVDARVAKDQRGPAGGDLSGPASRPFLVGVAFGIAPVEDDGGVGRDAEGAQGNLELFRGAAVPIARILQPVRVEVKCPGDVVLLGLLWKAGVDVDEEGSPGRRRPVAAASRAFGSPPVVGGQRPDVDDREMRVAEALSKFGQGDRRVRYTSGRIGAGHRCIGGGQTSVLLQLGNRAILPEIVDYVNPN